jgi:radical SAM superfamily enzyme YgiQ (UPF0313 family)
MRSPYLPDDMRLAPSLDPKFHPRRIRRRHALLVIPFYAKDPLTSFGKHVLTPTLTLTSIAASTPEGWTVEYWDENLLKGPPPSDPLPEVVGITVHVTFAHRAYDLAAWYHRMGAKVVLGGPHVISCPDEAAPHADAIALGEGVRTWPRILEDVRKGALRKIYSGSYKEPYAEEPIPRRTILPSGSFLTNTSLIATRGCHNRCGFCYMSTEGLNMPYHVKHPDRVAAEFRVSGGAYGVFIDNNLGSKPEYLRRLCRALRPLEKIWSAAVTIDVTDDPTLVREMALSGCTGVFVGFESLDDHNLRDSRKRSPNIREYTRRVRILHDSGIQVNGSFVFGFDHDHRDVFQRTVHWVEENRLECATFHVLTPYPGTPLFRQMESEGRLLHRNWSLYDTSHAVFRPRHMSPRELEEGYAWCYRRLFSSASIWRRRPEDLRAVPAYLAMSYFYKRCNPLWRFLIRHDLVAALWRPLVEASRRRHLQYRRRLAEVGEKVAAVPLGTVVSAGV